MHDSMNKRSYIREILAKKSRLLEDNARWRQVSVNLTKIIESLDQLDSIITDDPSSNLAEILPYFPIRLVACFEGYFRLVYADLIDQVPQFQNNTATNFKDKKLTLEDALSLRQHSLSLGEYIAHLLRTNNLGDIKRNVNGITGSDFIEDVKTTRAKLYPYSQTALLPEWEVDEDAQLISGVERIFELRHIFCHELAPTESVSIGEINEYSYTAVRFLHISEAVVTGYLTGSIPST
jgi:hypothetical protein